MELNSCLFCIDSHGRLKVARYRNHSKKVNLIMTFKSAYGKDSTMRQSHLLKAALANNVAPCFLSICGILDESSTIGAIIYLFNIEDSEHKRYKSTVGFKVNV